VAAPTYPQKKTRRWRGGQARSTDMTKSNIAPLRSTVTAHRELSWFAEKVEAGRRGPYTEITTVTPVIAQRLLDANEHNRPVNQRYVDEIASDIENGYWRLNGETIIVSKDGFLNDGQHRLEAVVKTGRPIETAIMYGVDRDSRMTVDMGRQRTAGNFLAMDGSTNTNNVASSCKVIIEYSRGAFHSNAGAETKITKQDIRDFYLKNRKRIDIAVCAASYEKFGKLAGVSAVAAAYFVLHRINDSEASVFFARFFDGANLKANDPILYLRNRLMTERKNKIRATEKLEIILRYWNAWRRGAKMSRQISREGVYPRIEK
jgi:hypothetical protein